MIYDDIVNNKKIENPYQELDRYNINNNFLHIRILSNVRTLRKFYIIVNKKYYIDKDFYNDGISCVGSSYYKKWLIEICYREKENLFKHVIYQYIFSNILEEK